MALLPLLVASCATVATRSDYDPDAHFSQYRTFDWVPDSASAENTQQDWQTPFLNKRIKQAVISAMQDKGLVKVDENPDLLVACYGTIKTKTNVHVYDYPYYGSPQRTSRQGAGRAG